MFHFTLGLLQVGWVFAQAAGLDASKVNWDTLVSWAWPDMNSPADALENCMIQNLIVSNSLHSPRFLHQVDDGTFWMDYMHFLMAFQARTRTILICFAHSFFTRDVVGLRHARIHSWMAGVIPVLSKHLVHDGA